MSPSESSTPYPELLSALLALMRTRLRAPTNALFDAIDNELFALAESVGGAEQQQIYFETMRECRRHRSQSMAAFIASIDQRVKSAFPESEPTRRSLSLVEHETLEIDLAVTAMSAHAGQRMGEVVFALNQRVAVVLNRPIDNDNDNPIGPCLLSRAFADVLSGLDLTLDVRLIALRLFDQHVLATLEPIYADINTRLVDAGILPELQPALRSEEHTSELQSLMRNSYAVFCLKKKKQE